MNFNFKSKIDKNVVILYLDLVCPMVMNYGHME